MKPKNFYIFKIHFLKFATNMLLRNNSTTWKSQRNCKYASTYVETAASSSNRAICFLMYTLIVQHICAIFKMFISSLYIGTKLSLPY